MKIADRKYAWLDEYIWLSWDQHAIRLHFAVGNFDFMWLKRAPRRYNLKRNRNNVF